MDLLKATQSRILELCKENNLTINGLATKSKMTQSTLNGIFDGTSKNPTLSTIFRLCVGLDMELKDFFDSEVFDNIK